MAARALAVLKMSPKVKTFITFAQSVATTMTDNSTFPSDRVAPREVSR